MHRTRLVILLFSLLLSLWVGAKETVIVGDVMAEETGQPIVNAHIVFQGSKVGTTSNEEGSFVLRVDLNQKMNLVISAIGYQTQRFPIEPGAMAGIQVTLKEKATTLTEIYVQPGANPALPLLEAVRAHRAQNDRFLQPQLTTQAQAQTQLYISNIQPKHLKRALWRSLQSGMISASDSSKMLALYTSTQPVALTQERYEPLAPATEEALILSASDYSIWLAQHHNIDCYQPSWTVMGTSFLSPLAASGTTYYRYYLVDSTATDSSKTYLVHFRTKNPFYATFDGEMVIDSATYAVRSIKASLPKEANVNYVHHLLIQQELNPDGSLQSEEVTALLDFAVKTAQIDSTAVFPSLLLRSSLMKTKTKTKTKTTTATGTGIENGVAATGSIRALTWLATIITTGYIPTGSWLEIGNIQEILQVNEYETVHVGLPLRTNEKLMKHVSLEAGIGYGFKDQALKGYGRVRWEIPSLRRNSFYVEYQDRYVWSEVDDFTRLLHENSIGYGTMDFTAYAFEALRSNPNTVNTATRKRQFQLYAESDWSEHFETQAYARIGWMGYGDVMVGYHNIPSFPYQSFGVIGRVGWKERKIDRFFSRYHVYSSLPILYAGIEATSYQTAEMEHYDLFAKFQVMVRQQANLGAGGSLDYALQLGCIVGTAPFQFWHHFEGNQGYAYDPFRFTLMNNYQYNATRWLALHAEWNGKGVLFNLIPGIRYLRLRELVTFKLAYGNYDNASAPYTEFGIGIGNILRVMDLYSVWRLTNRWDDTTPNWAMRFRIHLGL